MLEILRTSYSGNVSYFSQLIDRMVSNGKKDSELLLARVISAAEQLWLPSSFFFQSLFIVLVCNDPNQLQNNLNIA